MINISKIRNARSLKFYTIYCKNKSINNFNSITLLRIIITFMLLLIIMNACDVNVDRPEIPSTKFNKSFSGEIIVTQGEQDFVETINLNLTIGSSLEGTFFRKSDGAVGTISGSGTDVSATFTGTIDDVCPASFNGSLMLMDDNTLSIEMEGSDCNGQFNSVGLLTRVECIDIAGIYNVEETGTITCTIDGETETITISGEENILLEQNGCNISFRVPAFDIITREGEIGGNTLKLSGPFLAAIAGDVNFTKNEFVAEVTIVDEYNFTFTGSGIAEGTIDNLEFSCTGNSTGTLKRFFNVAVAVLRGGLVGDFEVDTPLDMIKNQAIRVDPKRIIGKGFGAGPDQLSRVGQWLNKIIRDGESQTNVFLIGHSLGGDAVRRSNFSNMCTRITIDPINPDLLPKLDQRDTTFSPVFTAGRFMNILASTKEDLDGVKGRGILGHRVTGAIERVEPVTNHFTVVTRVLVSGLVSDEVRGCLSAGFVPPTSKISWLHQMNLKHNRFFYFRFGWYINQ